jgi:methionine synthase II (cobalamin-independent)
MTSPSTTNRSSNAEQIWAPGAVTGIGSMPGSDLEETVARIFDELPLLPHLPELPARGAGADMIGRGATFLADMAVEIQPSGWTLTAHPGRDQRRARDFLSRDLDALEAYAGGHTGAVKVQLAGPWTLAANLELPSGHRVVSDHGATRDLAESLVEGLRSHLADLRRRLPSARLVVQLDEPSIPAVLGARVPTPSGYGTARAIEPSVVSQHLESVLAVVAAGGRVVHCCAADIPIALLRGAGADALSFDLAAIGQRQDDALGEAVEAGVSLWPGVLPALDARISLDTAREPITKLWRNLGFPIEQLAGAVVPTPNCGLAGASPRYARRVLSVLGELSKALGDELS